jgi:hypothetical protein
MNSKAVTVWFFATLVGLCSMILPTLFDVGYGGLLVPVGSAGSFFMLLFWASFGASFIASFLAWRRGEKWPLPITAILFTTLILPTASLIGACLSGNCL